MALAELLRLRTFDCRRCRQVSERESDRPVPAESDAETNALLAEVVLGLSQIERSILIRKSAGFSDRELNELFGRSLEELEALVKRLVSSIRSICHRPNEAGDT